MANLHETKWKYTTMTGSFCFCFCFLYVCWLVFYFIVKLQTKVLQLEQHTEESVRCNTMFLHIKPCVNGRNIVNQQLRTLLDVTCCVRLHSLLHVVAQKLKPVKLLATCKRTQQLPTLLGQQCWELLRASVVIAHVA